jgi:hypothetical protein
MKAANLLHCLQAFLVLHRMHLPFANGTPFRNAVTEDIRDQLVFTLF